MARSLWCKSMRQVLVGWQELPLLFDFATCAILETSHKPSLSELTIQNENFP